MIDDQTPEIEPDTPSRITHACHPGWTRRHARRSPSNLARQIGQQPLDEPRIRRRGSTRGNRPATQPINSSSIPEHGSTAALRHTTTTWSSDVNTTKDNQTMAALRLGSTHHEITIYGWSI
jgi:hypothetical protein